MTTRYPAFPNAPETGGHDYAFARRETVGLDDHAASGGIF